MQKRTTLIAGILSFLPLGQPLLINEGLVLSSLGLMFLVPEKANAESLEFYFNRGIEQAKGGNHFGAISDYNKVIEINPKYAEVYYNRAIAKVKLEDYYGAIYDYSKAIEIKPKYASAYTNRGITKREIGDLKGACADWRKASSLGHQRTSQWIREEC